jgi:hypothetical protein
MSIADTHQQVGMMIHGGDCAIVLDHPQEEDEEKEVNKTEKRGKSSSPQELMMIRVGRV